MDYEIYINAKVRNLGKIGRRNGTCRVSRLPNYTNNPNGTVGHVIDGTASSRRSCCGDGAGELLSIVWRAC